MEKFPHHYNEAKDANSVSIPLSFHYILFSFLFFSSPLRFCRFFSLRRYFFFFFFGTFLARHPVTEVVWSSGVSRFRSLIFDRVRPTVFAFAVPKENKKAISLCNFLWWRVMTSSGYLESGVAEVASRARASYAARRESSTHEESRQIQKPE